jgi:divalent metal cation (Fe/Co/Zn/Cd) transporter
MVALVSTATAFALERRGPRESIRPNTDQINGDPVRHGLVARALLLSKISVFWGLTAGAWGVTAGLLAGSLGVLGLGLNVLADVAGSIVLVWRFRVERRDPDQGHRAEARASAVVAAALSAVSITLIVAAANALVAGSAPEKSVMAMIVAGVSAVVLAPLGLAKYRTGVALHSHALKGDGTLSAIGAVLGGVALLGLLAEQVLGWWWADRCTAICVAGIAGAEAIRVLRMRPRPASTN